MSLRSLVLLVLVCSLSLVSNAQSCRTTEVPVGVINAAGDTLRGLAAQDFVTSKGAGEVKSLTFDDGPRRVLFVVDTSSKLSPNAHRAAAGLVQSLVAASRPTDSLALLTARGPGGFVKFGEDRANMTAALASADTGRSKQGMLDAMMDGMEWLSDSRPGDAIVLIAADLDGNHKTNAKAVAKALEERHIRVFGLALGPVLARSTVAGGSMTSTTSQGLAWTTPLTGAVILENGDENFFPLTVNSGGVVLQVVGSPSQPDNMDNPQVQQRVRQRGIQVFNMIANFYRIQVASPQLSRRQIWKLDVSEGVHKAVRQIWLLYPRALGPC